ncbi:opt oligopeptide transporter like protein [Zymoseptoria brevis]|uniref:Opt oligopeptide transporter like protein n=1 Tax=Zymoseptoria brevis TaxID=1047168 RepID=A0A0F4GQT5_9PEZI|nr:opt oligopeptide transporter like protein [Zymoseptoria brevis]
MDEDKQNEFKRLQASQDKHHNSRAARECEKLEVTAEEKAKLKEGLQDITLEQLLWRDVLATENSPYAEVRAVADPTDDPNMPCSTLRAWFLGIIFCCFGVFIDTLFAFRYPNISVSANVAQLVAYPAGTFLARVLPKWSFTIRGQKFELNPGPFSAKEHMMITIMANVAFTAPYTVAIIPVQALPQYFNIPFARDKAYQICISLAVNLFGVGLAGVLRRFLVYPSVAIWPTALQRAREGSIETSIYLVSREIFLWATLFMGIYFMLPGYLFGAMSLFSWMTWISPNNIHLDAVAGVAGGLGLNPWPTFDWNLFTAGGYSGLFLPTFSIVNQIVGVLIAAVMILIIWYSNAWQTGYLPINSNRTFDNTGSRFNVTKILNSKGLFDEASYQQYSQPWFSAGYIVYTIWCFASYTAALSYVYFFYRQTIVRGFQAIWRQVRGQVDDSEIEEDIHYRLMKRYKEVPDWHYVVLLVVPIVFGIAALTGWPTGASVGALFYGLLIPVIFILPIGIIQAVTGMPIAINTLAAILGGLINAGNANGLIFFKCWAYLSSWQALGFLGDLKLAHYVKVPPRTAFWCQIVATIIFAVVSSLQMNFIMAIKDRYNMMLLGFPLGFLLVFLYWLLQKKYPRSSFVRQIHPVMLCMGPVSFGAPYNLAFHLPNLYVNLFSFVYIRKRYLAFWSKWNYVISAAFSCGIAISALIIFFALQIPKDGNLVVNWWGNNVVNQGCEGSGGCPRLEVGDSGTFGPASWS